jgi:hypothetical protein
MSCPDANPPERQTTATKTPINFLAMGQCSYLLLGGTLSDLGRDSPASFEPAFMVVRASFSRKQAHVRRPQALGAVNATLPAAAASPGLSTYAWPTAALTIACRCAAVTAAGNRTWEAAKQHAKTRVMGNLLKVQKQSCKRSMMRFRAPELRELGEVEQL